MPRAVIAASAIVVAAAAAVAGGYVWLARAPRIDPEQSWAMIGEYCTECHNRDDYTADIAFDSLTPESVAHEGEIFEAAVRKLRGNMMPPPGHPQPDKQARWSAIRWLESALDEAHAAQPNPGRIALHRLNRTEYANAIEDLLALQVDAAALLPKDDESDGFDNVANVLKVSPSFLDQYISAARVIATAAVGDPATRMDSRVYYAQPNVNQSFHVEGMPLGTRGGMLVEHYFPADGDYEFSIGGLARARYVEGLEYRHKLILTIDGVKVFENALGGPEDQAAVDLRQAAAVAEINSRFEDIRVPVTAGPRKVAATFVARTMAESDSVLEPFIPGGGEVGIIEGEESPLKVQRLEVNGPFEATGIERYAEPAKDFRVSAERGNRGAGVCGNGRAPLHAPSIPETRDRRGSCDSAAVLRERPRKRRLRDRHPQRAHDRARKPGVSVSSGVPGAGLGAGLDLRTRRFRARVPAGVLPLEPPAGR